MLTPGTKATWTSAYAPHHFRDVPCTIVRTINEIEEFYRCRDAIGAVFSAHRSELQTDGDAAELAALEVAIRDLLNL